MPAFMTIPVGQGIPSRLLPSRACFRLPDAQIYKTIKMGTKNLKNKKPEKCLLEQNV
jgi:hypothetical protein